MSPNETQILSLFERRRINAPETTLKERQTKKVRKTDPEIRLGTLQKIGKKRIQIICRFHANITI